MNFKEKRHVKKLAKIFTTLAYVVMVAWALTVIGGLIRAMTAEVEISGMAMFVYGVAPIIMTLVLGFTGQRFVNKRVAYKQGIEKYRQRVFFTRAIKTILMGGKDAFKHAARTYECLNEDALRRFIYSFVLTASYFSDEEKTKEKGNNTFMDLLETYDPEKVDLHKKISLI